MSFKTSLIEDVDIIDCIKRICNPIQAKEYFAQAKSLQQYCMPVRNRLGNIYSRETRFIVKKPWHICYLTYWTYNILFE